MKGQKLQIIDIEEAREIQVEGTGNIFLIQRKKIPKLKKEMPNSFLKTKDHEQRGPEKKQPTMHHNKNTKGTQKRKDTKICKERTPNNMLKTGLYLTSQWRP